MSIPLIKSLLSVLLLLSALLALFTHLCKSCHYANRTDTIIGPGLKGLLKGPRLPVSGRPATAEYVFNQLQKLFKDMPSFKYLPDEEVFAIIAYLNTL